MKRAIALLMLAAVFAAALLIPSVALAEAPPGNADCLECHAVGGNALSHVDFSASPVELTKCLSCHWVDRHWFEVFHLDANHPDYMNRQCNTCHGSDLPTRPALIGDPTFTNENGSFQSAASLSATSGALHAIHANGSWPQDAKGDIAGCVSCHGKVACDACHTAPSAAHADHAKSGGQGVAASADIGKKYGDATPDTYLYAKSPATNYGGGVGMYIGHTGSGEERSIVRFPLAKVGAASVTTATLQLTRISAGANYPLRAYRLRRKDWSEMGASWNAYKAGSAWGTAGAKNAATDYYSDVYAESTAGNGTFNVTALVQAAMAEGDAYIDFLLVDPAPVSRRYVGFYTQGTTVADWMPALKVEGTTGSSAYSDPPITYRVAAGSPEGFDGSDLSYMTTSTCVSLGCHALANATLTGQFLPACAACHPDRVAVHGYSTAIHTAAPGSGSYSINGATYGPLACTECHGTDLDPEHNRTSSSTQGDGCVTCHPAPRDTVGTWGKTCTEGGCHTAVSADPQHSTIDAAHALPATTPSCLAAGCHTGGDLAALHSGASTTTPGGGTRTSCLVCHTASSLPSGDCADCHDMNNPHPELTAVHQATVFWGPVAVFDPAVPDHDYVVWDMNCSDCHASSNLMVVHNNSNCATCHATGGPVGSLTSSIYVETGALVDAGFENGTDGASLTPAWTLSGAPQRSEYDNTSVKVGNMAGWIQGPTTAAYAGVANAATAGMTSNGAEMRFWAYFDTANENRVLTDGCTEIRWNTSGQIMVYTKRTATGYTPNAYTVVGTYAPGWTQYRVVYDFVSDTCTISTRAAAGGAWTPLKATGAPTSAIPMREATDRVATGDLLVRAYQNADMWLDDVRFDAAGITESAVIVPGGWNGSCQQGDCHVTKHDASQAGHTGQIVVSCGSCHAADFTVDCQECH